MVRSTVGVAAAPIALIGGTITPQSLMIRPYGSTTCERLLTRIVSYIPLRTHSYKFEVGEEQRMRRQFKTSIRVISLP